MRVWIFAFLLCVATYARAEDLTLKTSLQPQKIEQLTNIGSINVLPLGKVSFTAKKNGAQIVILAKGPDGALLGRAEATLGLNSAPIHIATPTGLKKIEIIWNSTAVR